jgi:hypothetical protein
VRLAQAVANAVIITTARTDSAPGAPRDVILFIVAT